MSITDILGHGITCLTIKVDKGLRFKFLWRKNYEYDGRVSCQFDSDSESDWGCCWSNLTSGSQKWYRADWGTLNRVYKYNGHYVT